MYAPAVGPVSYQGIRMTGEAKATVDFAAEKHRKVTFPDAPARGSRRIEDAAQERRVVGPLARSIPRLEPPPRWTFPHREESTP